MSRMTDRHSGYVVMLDQDIRDDDAEATINALRQIKGVLAVKPVVSDGLSENIGRRRERDIWRRKLIDLVRSREDF